MRFLAAVVESIRPIRKLSGAHFGALLVLVSWLVVLGAILAVRRLLWVW